MTPVAAAEYIRFLTNTDSTSFTDTTIKLLMNVKKNTIADQIIGVNEDYFGVPETTDLIADQREYPFPTTMLSQIKRLEAAFELTSPLAYIKLTELDLTTYKHGTDEATIISYFDNSEGSAKYDIFRNAIRLYAGTIIDVPSGLKLWTYQYPSDITDLTSTVDMSEDPSPITAGFPKQFHESLCLEVSSTWKSAKPKPIPLNEQEQARGIDLQLQLNSIKKLNLDRETQATIPYMDGSSF